MGDDDRPPFPPDPRRRARPVPHAVLAAVGLDALALGAGVTLIVSVATSAVDRGIAAGVLVATITAALLAKVNIAPSARPGTTGRLLGRELVVVSLSLL